MSWLVDAPLALPGAARRRRARSSVPEAEEEKMRRMRAALRDHARAAARAAAAIPGMGIPTVPESSGTERDAPEAASSQTDPADPAENARLRSQLTALQSVLSETVQRAERRDRELADLHRQLQKGRAARKALAAERDALRRSLEAARQQLAAHAAHAAVPCRTDDDGPEPPIDAEARPETPASPVAARAPAQASMAPPAPIHDYWLRRELASKLPVYGVRSLTELAATELVEACRAEPARTRSLLLVAHAQGEQALELARHALDQGARDFRVDCLVPNGARTGAAPSSLPAELSARVRMLPGGLANLEAPGHYAVCLADRALADLAHPGPALDRLLAALAPQAGLVISDRISTARAAGSPEALRIIERIWSLMPERLRRSASSGRPVEDFAGWARSRQRTGPAAPELPALLRERGLHAERFLAFGHLVELLLDAELAGNFDLHSERDRRFVDQLARLDDEKVEAGLLAPTRMLGIWRRTRPGS